LTPSEAVKAAQLKLYQQIADIYEKYEAYLEKNNLVDFDDLLLLPYKILKNNQKLARNKSKISIYNGR
jgi:DNA helicase-2/ATP-dependent DNA helicase PcrA